ncbi:hypothetical protein GF391_03335 [Candidatus Uhrbacteria bacterium]|nr:hypothetical protein [Candidatus Uhrbacteria bacterium]
MQVIKPTTWEEVFQSWRDNEAHNPGWIRCATEIKGWPDWESWRRYMAGKLKLEKKDWELYRFSNPLAEVSEMLVGPFTAWQKNLPVKNVLSFGEFLEVPEKYEQFSNHDTVRKMMDSMPFTSFMTGLIREDNRKLVCIEGHHRAAALALANKLGRKIDFGDEVLYISLSLLPKDELYLLDKALELGSEKPS